MVGLRCPVRPSHRQQSHVCRIQEAGHVCEHDHAAHEHDEHRETDDNQHEQFDPVHRRPGLGPVEKHVPRSGPQPFSNHRHHHVHLVRVHRNSNRLIKVN